MCVAWGHAYQNSVRPAILQARAVLQSTPGHNIAQQVLRFAFERARMLEAKVLLDFTNLTPSCDSASHMALLSSQ